MKKLLAGLAAIAAAYIIFKLLYWVFWLSISFAITLMQIFFVLILAVPLYIIISKRILR